MCHYCAAVLPHSGCPLSFGLAARTDQPFSISFVESEKEQHRSPPIYRRYSLRYGPGSSIIPPGYGTEPSVLWDESNGGRTADQVCELTGPWYPRANPADFEEIRNLYHHSNTKLAMAYDIQEQRKQEMRPLLSKHARQQQQQHARPPSRP
mmetsp:Transcript_17836/g.41775  ORF Transcript_17836/g.41775 Transcript_17836/m.41775 type:complete len:151 (-) Transcript_17836:100-552(-)